MRDRQPAWLRCTIGALLLALLNSCVPWDVPQPPSVPHRDTSPPPVTPVITRALDDQPPGRRDCLARGAFPPLLADLHYGVNAFLLYTDQQRLLDLTRNASFGWVRQQIHWRDIEINPGRYDWRALDQAVAAARHADLEVLLSVVRSPRWVTASGTGGLPDDPATLASFMSALAAHYAGQVGAYEIWNEPNLASENGGLAATPAQYLATLAAAYPAVKQSDPCALVLAAPLAPTATDDRRIATDDLRFYRELYALGDGAFLRAADLLALHPGGGDHAFDARWTDDAPSASRFYFRHVEEIRAIMQQANDPRQAWITEVGWSTTAALGAPPPVTPELQAANLVGALRLTRRQYRWVTGIFVWNLNFAVLGAGNDEKSTFGILAPDWTPRPAYLALQIYLRGQAAERQQAMPQLSAGAPYQTRWLVAVQGKLHSPPAVGADGTVYIGSDPGHFYAFAPGGGLRWVFDAPGGTRFAPALGLDGTIYLGDESGQLTALRPDGTALWKQMFGGGIRGTPQIAEDALYLATADGAALSMDLNGRMRWRVPLDGAAAPPLLSGGMLYVATEAGTIWALSTAGELRWRAAIGHPIICAPVRAGNQLLVGDAEGHLTSLNARSGQQNWQRQLVERIESPSLGPNSPLINAPPLVADDGMLYLGGRDGTLTALDPVGNIRWRYDTGSDIAATPLQGDDGALLIGLYDQRLLAIQTDGALRWQVRLRGAVRATPLGERDGTLYVATIGGVLYALAART